MSRDGSGKFTTRVGGAPGGGGGASEGGAQRPAAFVEVTPRPVEGDFDGEGQEWGGTLDFAVVEDVASGGEGRVLVVEYAGGRRYALKAFASAASARTEWNMLSAHKNSRVVPYPYMVGTLTERLTPGVGAQWCIVMEHIEGVTLQELIDQRRGEAFSLEEAAALMAPVLRFASQSCASRRRDVHRDIKPDNLIVDAAGATRLVDFGFSSRPGRAAAQGAGSRGYAAPELECASAEGVADDQARSDPRLDSYSIAAVLLTMLSGEPPAPRDPHAEALRRADRLAVRHDDAVVEDLVGRLAEDVTDNFGLRPARRVLADSVRVALGGIDADVRDALCRALAPDQARRPDPRELETRLAHVVNREVYLKQVVVDARARCYAYERGATPAPVRAGGDFLASEGEFIDGLNAFNRGEYRTALPILRKQSSLGNASASYYLAVCLRDGLGVDPVGVDEVASLLTEAANQGNMLARNALGRLLLEKEGLTPAERARAVEWIRLAAAPDPSQGNAGFREARRWLAEQGLA